MVAKQVVAALLIAVLACPAHADCRQFFVQKQRQVYYQQAYVQAVAVPYYQPPIYYSAGADIQAEALAEKVARMVESKLALRQQQTAPETMRQPVVTSAFAKCIRCHTGPEPAGGLTLDGTAGVTCHTYYRWGQIAGQGRDVPDKMKALVASMTPEQKGAINEELLDLVETNLVRVDPLPQPLPPPPLPPRDGGLE